MQRSWHLRRGSGIKSTRRSRRGLRSVEWLEPRMLLAVPELAPISDVTVLAGAPTYVVLDGFDADGHPLAFAATVSNAQLSNPANPSVNLNAIVSANNRSLKLSVDGFGDMVFELFENWAPQTTARIIELANAGFYDGLTFHRVIENFVIQGGDPLGNGSGGSGRSFDDEYHPFLQHTSAGVLSMAKSYDDTNDSQFFITAQATRALDFNHSVFGFLTQGEAVRQAIAAVETGANDRPVNPVVISSADVFVDTENGVLVLYVPDGTTGQADVTITATDVDGNTAQRTFHVTVQPDPIDNNAYLLPIAPVRTAADNPVSFVIPAVSIEDDPVEYFAQKISPTEDLTVSVNQLTGAVTVIPKNGIAGVFQIQVAVRDPNAFTVDAWDSQLVPVYVEPPPPEGVELLAASDSGVSQSDRLTNRNNTAGNTLTFRVSGVMAGAEVWLLIDGVDLGHVVAAGNSVAIETTAGFPLSDGVHSVVAVQVLRNQQVVVGNLRDTVDLFSADSTPLLISVDTQPPVFTSAPVVEGAVGRLYQYDADVADEAIDQVVYELSQAPAGMSLVDPLAGKIAWLPGHDQSGLHPVVLRVMDAAGNDATQQFQIAVANAPDLDPIGPKQVVEGETLRFTVTAQGDHQPFQFELGPGAPAGAVIDPQSGQFTWTPTEAQGPGEYTITVRVSNTRGAMASQTVPVSVAEHNQPPELAAVDDVLVNEGELVQRVLQAQDGDLPAQELVFELVGQVPGGMSLDRQTGLLQWRPSEAQGPGDYAITVRVTDSYGASDQKSFVIHVTEVDEAPEIGALPDQVLLPGARLELAVLASDPDVPTKAIRYSLDSSPPGMTIHPDSGLLTWDVPADVVGPAAFRREVSAVIRATEIAADGSPGRSATVDLRIEVVEVRALAAAALVQQGSNIDTRSAPTRTATQEPGEADQLLTLPASSGQALRSGTSGMVVGSAFGISDVRQSFPGTIQLDRFGLAIRPTAGITGERWQLLLPIEPASTPQDSGSRAGRQSPMDDGGDSDQRRSAVHESSRSDTQGSHESVEPIAGQQPLPLPPEAADAAIAWLAQLPADGPDLPYVARQSDPPDQAEHQQADWQSAAPESH